MAKVGEINYLGNIGHAGVMHSVNKPFSDGNRAGFLQEIAALFSLLPPPPARILDLGCGTGWTSLFFARAGYEVVGTDIAPDMIFHAEEQRRKADLDNLTFLVRDYEELDYHEQFDAVVFYDALHHAVDEKLALHKAFEALRPGGVCLTSEPGVGHSHNPISIRAMELFGVTEKDMPPKRIIAIGKALGFREFSVFPFAWDNLIVAYSRGASPPRRGPLQRFCVGLFRSVLRISADACESLCRVRHALKMRTKRTSGGITCMVK